MTSNLYPALLLKEQKLRFMRAHQEAFVVEPWYPLQLFEEFVSQIDAEVEMEASCKIEGDQLLAARFLIFFSEQFKKRLAHILGFFLQVESRADVQINCDLLHQFLGKSFDFSKVKRLSTGVDLRRNLADSSLKMHIVLDNYPEKVDAALALYGDHSTALREIARQTVSLIGLDFYLDGRSEIELYTVLSKEEFQQPSTQAFLGQIFPPFVLYPLQATDTFYVGLSKANADPVLYYHLKNKKDLLNYFAINDTAHKVHSFYQHQTTRPSVIVGLAQSELQKTRIENIRLYYHQSFCHNS